MKVFLDTNVLAAGFATRGLCSDIIRTVLESHEFVSSLEILAELKRVLLKKFRIPAKKAEGILELVHSSSLISAPDRDATYPIVDSDDIPHLSAAEQAGCNVFVTGDKELWTLSPLGTMRIISPREFWDMISA